MSNNLPEHSPLGASAAERWMNCPGSINLIKQIAPRDETADPEYRTEGTAAHEAIAFCLSGGGYEAWEVIGQSFGKVPVEITVETADAIQVFLDKANALAAGAEHTYIEAHLNDPDNKWLYGTIDFGAIKDGQLSILDYKHGQGIVVETEGNPQILYYAYLLLLKHPDVRQVSMQIVQPRIPHEPEEPWVVTAEYVMEWAEKTLLPAVKRTEMDGTLLPGPHCRFCPAKENLVCPALKKQFEQAAKTDPKYIAGMGDEELLKLYSMIETVKMYAKAIGDETLRRLMQDGMKDNGKVKLVNKKANRVWKSEAFEIFKSRFGLGKIMSKPEFLSPAEISKIDADAKKLVHEYAYTPQTGYTVADYDDRRPAVKPQIATAAFNLDKVD